MTTLNHILQAGRPRRNQLNMIDIFNVVDTLKQRGFVGVSEASIDDTLISELSSTVDSSSLLSFLDKLNEKSFRIAVRRKVFGDATEKDIERLGKLSIETSVQNEQRYSKTIELLIAYLCVKELSAFSASFGVHIEGTPKGGDYDCIANFQNSLYYFEVKSGKVGNITPEELQHFLYRHDFLCPDASVLFLDYSGIDDTVIRQFLGLILHPNHTYTVSRILKCSDGRRKAYMVHPGVLVVDIANNNDTLSNIRFAMQFLRRYKTWSSSALWGLVSPDYLGVRGDVLEI